MSEFFHKTLHLKLKPGKAAWLAACAREVNQVWNFCNETSAKAARPFVGAPRYLTAYDMQKLLTGAYKEFRRLPANSINRIAEEHAARRHQHRRQKLSWRSKKKSLGWVPFKGQQARWVKGAVVFAGQRFRVFDSYGLSGVDFRSGCFSQDALGDWYFNVVVRLPAQVEAMPSLAVGIDLGLKVIATTSDGDELGAGRWIRDAAPRLAMAHRRAHKRQAARIHRRVARQRSDALHKFSTGIVRKYGAIYIGDVSSTKLAKTRMAKSVLDSGWGMLKTMLQYKGHQAGCIVEIINESFTTRACADCGSLTGPQGRTGLAVRGWVCSDCGTEHRRDVNAARNILARGLARPSAGTNGGVPRIPAEIRGKTAKDSQLLRKQA